MKTHPRGAGGVLRGKTPYGDPQEIYAHFLASPTARKDPLRLLRAGLGVKRRAAPRPIRRPEERTSTRRRHRTYPLIPGHRVLDPRSGGYLGWLLHQLNGTGQGAVQGLFVRAQRTQIMGQRHLCLSQSHHVPGGRTVANHFGVPGRCIHGLKRCERHSRQRRGGFLRLRTCSQQEACASNTDPSSPERCGAVPVMTSD